MKNKFILKIKAQWLETIIVSLFWLLFFASPFFINNSEESIRWEHVYNQWSDFLPLLVVFFINRFLLLPQLLFRNKRWLYFISAIMLVIITAFATGYLNRAMGRKPDMPPSQSEFRTPPPMGGRPNGHMPDFQEPPQDFKPEGMRQNPPLRPYSNIWIMMILVLSFDTALNVFVKWTQTEQERFKLQKKHTDTQLAFLRNQISPHFFMNTLNNIHSLIEIDQTEAQEAIIKLSNLMRHLLYDSENGFTSIKKELDFVNSYIELMKLRYSDKVNISLQIPQEIPNKEIAPLLFTSLLENAFKYGISYNKASFISIAITFKEDKLNFEISNSKTGKKATEGSSGIGLKNLKQRLDLIYKNNYTLNIGDQEETFIVLLSIPI